jgi:hypothetical protein
MRYIRGMRTDLHIHTTASDGSWTPAELIGQLEQAGIRLFAVRFMIRCHYAASGSCPAAGLPF